MLSEPVSTCPGVRSRSIIVDIVVKIVCKKEVSR